MADEGGETGSSNGEQQHQTDSANNIFMKRKIFNDPIHGTMEIHPVCVRIMDTPQFQRLRHIKQLDACYMVYPGASHNRFEHSIGVSYLAGKLLKTIKDQQPEENITERDILCVEIAGLCHDLGQGPFSHVFEKRFMPSVKKDFKHEAMARKMFEEMLEGNDKELKKDIQKILGECNIPDFQTFEEDDFTFIKEMIDVPKNIEQRPWPYNGREENNSYMYEIVANRRNGIDVDRWDYLARDSYMLGLKINFDYNRCFATARVLKCDGLERKQICFREKEAHGLISMFYTRMTLYRQAYQHKTHSAIGMMICDALKDANDKIEIAGKSISDAVDDMTAFTLLTDDMILTILNPLLSVTQFQKADSEDPIKAKKILDNIYKRNLYKFVTELHIPTKKYDLNKVKKRIDKFLRPDNNSVKNLIEYDVVRLDYGMKEQDPLEKIQFYTKDEPNKGIQFERKQVSYLLPKTFEEVIVRFYCKPRTEENQIDEPAQSDKTKIRKAVIKYQNKYLRRRRNTI